MHKHKAISQHRRKSSSEEIVVQLEVLQLLKLVAEILPENAFDERSRVLRLRRISLPERREKARAQRDRRRGRRNMRDESVGERRMKMTEEDGEVWVGGEEIREEARVGTSHEAGVRDTPLCIPSERETLLKFKHHLTDPSNRLSSWNNASANSNCCHWAGVVCSNETAHVVELHLNNPIPPFHVAFPFDAEDFYKVEGFWKAFEASHRYQLGGEINPCLADLEHLNYVDLSRNYGLGEGKSIPAFLGAMTSLTHLDLSETGFNGKIPPLIGNLSNLVYLDLSSDFYVENVDWLSRLSKLEYLYLEGANLSKAFHWLHTLQALPSLTNLRLSWCTLPLPRHSQPSALNFSSLLTLGMSFNVISFFPKWIFGLAKLVSLDLSDNIIEGPIPYDFQNLTLLQTLDLSHNLFSSSIPDSIYGLRHLKFLRLDENNLNGSISNALGNLTFLIELDLSYNFQLEGTIPTSLERLTSLVRLELSNNHLSGNLPDQIGDFENVAILDFSINSIGGTLPISFGKLSSLKFLRLSRNHFIGNPFESLKSLCKLSYLDIADNHFQGIINEDDLADFTSLKSFYTTGNNFTLKVGPNWYPSFQLTYWDMRSWKLGPKFPSWIQSQKNLQYLDMSNTWILDYIPTWFSETLRHASYVNLSHNHIQGKLMTTLTNPLSINVIDLSRNHLCGKLPYLSKDVNWLDMSSNSFSETMDDFLCQKQDNLMQLQFLNLASNKLSGRIPDCWINWNNLMVVNLQSNHFIGNLPPSIGYLSSLRYLNIRNNSLLGIFPTTLRKNNQLISLDLGENNLSGTIPSLIGESLLNLRILRLRSNSFSGHIPNEICNMTFLQDLDFAYNSLSGNIPSCFSHLNAMFEKNKSSDLFIYSGVTTQYMGEDTAISVFLWTKGRDAEYKSILGLVTNVDLSNNNLFGIIPREIIDLDGLIYLNLSHNQLYGEIPPSIGNMRLLESIDISRNQISGEIPSTISNLSFLNRLDMSHNHLKGKIPTGTQIQSFEASDFAGNNLCGPPLPTNCDSNQNVLITDNIGAEIDGHEVNWFFVSMAIGFVVGFWTVVAPLLIYRSWRYVYFSLLDEMLYKLKSY
ncbi:hypothetical protein Fmac_015908 [Flemingia macrophylla]|uniref:Leucine-rich repeat-containing N-terminal plant-type domain-containing protein n=1 Tax=Flemingia macrophylla TaxID=520843 RepID=A0ABD1MFW5_9FABA